VNITLGNALPVEVHHHDPENAAHVQRLEVRGGRVETDGSGQLHVIPLDPVVNNQTVFKVADESTPRQVVADVLASLRYHTDGSPLWVLVEDDNKARGHLVGLLLAQEWNLPAPKEPVALVTNGGLDYTAAQLGGSPSATNVAVNIALTADSASPASSDSALPSEYNHTSAGLNRKAATYAHTTGAGTYTLSATWTANSNDSLPFTANKMGVFSQLSGGTMVLETLVSPAITWNASGDQGTVVDTVSI
jgi:hypothetical protein